MQILYVLRDARGSIAFSTAHACCSRDQFVEPHGSGSCNLCGRRGQARPGGVEEGIDGVAHHPEAGKWHSKPSEDPFQGRNWLAS